MAKKTLGRKLRMGMVGGGPGAFIGGVHRKAALMDGQIELVAGAFSSTASKSKQQGKELNLDPKRVYASYGEMIEKELALPEGERIDFVSIVTPNFMHYPVARDFVNAGFHVVCDKPMTLNVKEARDLCKLVKKKKVIFALTHNYTGYPMVKLARDMVQTKKMLGAIRKIRVQYPQGWLATRVEDTGAKGAVWRTDPKKSGAAGCMGDIGTHAENLAEYITGLRMTEICADLTTFCGGRKLDDDGNCLVHWEKGVKGLLYASQIAIGEENGLAIWVHGTKGTIEWHQEDPNRLLLKKPELPVEVWSRGNPYIEKVSPAAVRATRIPSGHPEGFLEAFGNIYANFGATLRARLEGRKADKFALDFPDVEDGLRGMLFIESVVKSGKAGAKWVTIPKK